MCSFQQEQGDVMEKRSDGGGEVNEEQMLKIGKKVPGGIGYGMGDQTVAGELKGLRGQCGGLGTVP